MKERDISIDILRGLAIFTMIAANMAPYNFEEPHGFLFRIYGSVAAPMFVFLAGMMVSYTASLKNYPVTYYLKRGGATILVAALIDSLIWDILPFITYDVLYIIGLAMPIIYFFIKLKRVTQLVCIALIFAITPVLHYFLGYAESPSEVIISEGLVFENAANIPVWRQFLFEGWFPFFPWIGVSLLGAFVGTFKIKLHADDFNKHVGTAGAIMLVVGLGFWLAFMPDVASNESFDGSPYSKNFWGTLITREGYSELFYPPTLFYHFTFLGAIFILIPLMYRWQKNKVLNLLTVYGRSSMLVYILHTLFIAFIFSNEDFFLGNIGVHPLGIFLLIYLAHALVLWAICYGVQKLKKGKKFPFLINFILGG